MTVTTLWPARGQTRPLTWTFALFALFVGLVQGTQAAQSAVTCGTVITQDTVLKNDVGPCAGDGLVIGASGITVNLNGRRIFGTQRTYVGVRLMGVTNVTIRGGIVEGFDTGVLISGGLSNQIVAMTVQNNRFGIWLENAEASDHHVENNVVTNNRLIGVFLRSAVFNATIQRNQVNSNIGYGIVLAGGSAYNLVAANEAVGNGASDIVIRGKSFAAVVANLSPPLFQTITPQLVTLIEGIDYRVTFGKPFAFLSSRAIATGRLVPINISLHPNATVASNPNPVDTSTSGCQIADFASVGFQPGDVALLQRGTCELDGKFLTAAISARASAIVIFNEGQAPDRTSPNFGYFDNPLGIWSPLPVLSLSYARGFELARLAANEQVQVHLETEAAVASETVTPEAHNNTITKNTATSAVDENTFCGVSAGEADIWTNNAFVRVNRPCVGGDYSGDSGSSGGLGSFTNAY